MDENVKATLVEAGVNVQTALERFMGNEQLMVKFLKKFTDDTNFQKLVSAIEEKNWEEAFKAAHTMKGLCGNLSIENLQNLVSEQTEFLRAGNGEEAAAMMPQVQEAYDKVTAVLLTL